MASPPASSADAICSYADLARGPWRQLQLDEKRDLGVRRKRNAVLRVRAVLVQHPEAPPVEHLDGRDVEPPGIAFAPGPPGPLAQLGDHPERQGFARERHQRQARRRRRGDDAERGLDDDAKGALRADEEVDEVHARRGVVAGGPLRHIGHHVGRHRHTDDAGRRLDLEVAVGVRAHVAAHDIEHLARREDHRERPHPVARAAVFERGGA